MVIWLHGQMVIWFPVSGLRVPVSVLDGDFPGDVRVRLIVDQFKILVVKVKDRADLRVDLHLRKTLWLARQLQPDLFQVILVDVNISAGPDKVAWLQPGDLGHHHGEQGIRRDVERDAQKDVATSLVQLAGELPVCDIKLKQDMAGRQVHQVEFAHVPGAYQQTPRIGILFDCLDDLGDLVNMPAVGGRPGAPLVPVDMSEIALFVRPLIPDSYPMFLEVFDIGVSVEKP